MGTIRHIPIVVGLAFILSGCCLNCGKLGCDQCADIPRGAIPQPLGSHACAWQSAQDALAEKDDFVIYQYEWQGESAELAPFGRRHIAVLKPRLMTQLSSIMVEPSANPAIDNQRKGTLVALLTSHGITDAESRVRVGYPTAEGLYGPDSQRLERGYFRGGAGQGGLGGGFSGGSGLGSSSLGGSSFGGGGTY